MRALWGFIKQARYEILFAFEAIALLFGSLYFIFGRKKHSSFLVAVSTLLGSLITLSGVKRLNSRLKSRKYIDIISVKKKDISEDD